MSWWAEFEFRVAQGLPRTLRCLGAGSSSQVATGLQVHCVFL